MGEELRSLDDLLDDPSGLSEDEYVYLYSERTLGAAAILLHQHGKAREFANS